MVYEWEKSQKKTHLSRPAVSHHLKILKEAEIVNLRREGTKNYYYLDSKITMEVTNRANKSYICWNTTY